MSVNFPRVEFSGAPHQKHAEPHALVRKFGNLIDARKFGCDVSVHQYVLTDSGEGETAWWLIFLQHSSSTQKALPVEI